MVRGAFHHAKKDPYSGSPGRVAILQILRVDWNLARPGSVGMDDDGVELGLAGQMKNEGFRDK